MSEISTIVLQFHFLRPWWLVALAALPLLFGFGLRQQSMPAALSRLVDAELLPYLLRGQPANRHLPMALLALDGCLAHSHLQGPPGIAWRSRCTRVAPRR